KWCIHNQNWNLFLIYSDYLLAENTLTSTGCKRRSFIYPAVIYAFALTARASQCIFCEQVVRVNQVHVILYEGTFYAKLCVGRCKALRWRLQSFALAVAKLCVGGCNALRRQMQCFALADAMLCVRDGQSLHRNRQSYFG
ncbi:MAG: hypothetical protein PUE15_00365, partial [Prevotella sp.]|nr:hypothetical protein [Prevotella sp.]